MNGSFIRVVKFIKSYYDIVLSNIDFRDVYIFIKLYLLGCRNCIRRIGGLVGWLACAGWFGSGSSLGEFDISLTFLL